MRGFRRLLVVLLALLLMAVAVPVQGAYLPTDGPSTTAADDYAFVQFSDPPLASYNGGIKGYAATKSASGKKLDLNSPTAKKYGERLAAQRENYKKWLTKQYPQVQVVTEYSVTFNGLGLKLNGATLKQIQGGPGAVLAGSSATYTPAMNVSAGVIDAQPLWEALGGQANAGAGIKVGVIDTGIDQNHPFLSPEGFTMPDGFPKGDERFTSNKVIVAKVFHQDPWQTAEAIGSHGTHVSGTIAGKPGTDAPLASGLSGIAPAAWLGNYNVFPGDVENAKSLFIAKAVEEAVIDGMDVLNLSLGGTPHKGADLLDMAVNAAVDAGVVVAIAAGNEGPGNYTVGSPGTASNVITVAAVTNAHQFAATVVSNGLGQTYLAQTGDNGAAVTAPVSGEYVPWNEVAGDDVLACTPIAEGSLTDKIALIQRGTCTFSTKITNAAAAGAKAVIIYQNSTAEPIPMSTPGTSIPAVMISKAQGLALKANEGDRGVTINPPAEQPYDAAKLANFSSRGPTPNYTLKPDVAAVGVNVYSSVVGGGYAVYNGTSMATPHVAGAAAALLSLHPDWSPAQVKAALMGTTLPVMDSMDPLQIGAGLIDLGYAMNPAGMAFPSSLSFGLVRPVGEQTYSMTLTLQNPTGSEQTYTLADVSGTNLSFSPASVTVPAGGSGEVTVTVVNRGDHGTPGQAGTPEMVRGYVIATGQSGIVKIPYLYIIDYNR